MALPNIFTSEYVDTRALWEGSDIVNGTHTEVYPGKAEWLGEITAKGKIQIINLRPYKFDTYFLYDSKFKHWILQYALKYLSLKTKLT